MDDDNPRPSQRPRNGVQAALTSFFESPAPAPAAAGIETRESPELSAAQLAVQPDPVLAEWPESMRGFVNKNKVEMKWTKFANGDNLNNMKVTCVGCDKTFRGLTARVRAHLLGITKRSVTTCKNTPINFGVAQRKELQNNERKFKHGQAQRAGSAETTTARDDLQLQHQQLATPHSTAISTGASGQNLANFNANVAWARAFDCCAISYRCAFHYRQF